MALAVIWMSVGVGVVLGLWQRVAKKTTGPIRTFAVVAAGLVVAFSLLPHAIASEGLLGLCAALGSVALVPALERLVRVPFRNVSVEGLRLELGFVGLLAHRFGDGVVMAVEGHGVELSWAVGAHEIPIVALVTLAYARRGLRPALVRALLLGLASSLGFWLVRAMPGTWHELHGWVDAIAAGILVHILAYEALPESLETARERAFDGLGAVLGLSIVIWPSLGEHAEVPDVAHRVLDAALQAAPFLVLGLASSAALVVYRRRALPPGSIPRIGIGRPWPALEAVALSAGSLGWLAAGGQLLAAALLARGGARAARHLARPAADGASVTAPARSAELGFWATVEGLLLRVGGWIALGLLAASYIEAFVPEGSPLRALGVAGRAAFVVAIAIPASVCTAGAVPIAAALAAKGLSPVLAVGGLVIGPVLSDTLASLARAGAGTRRAALWLAPVALIGLVAVLGLDALLGEAPGAPPASFGAASALDWAAFAGLVGLGARNVWRVGIRGWLGSSLQALGPIARRHAHAH